MVCGTDKTSPWFCYRKTCPSPCEGEGCLLGQGGKTPSYPGRSRIILGEGCPLGQGGKTCPSLCVGEGCPLGQGEVFR
ncbi:hypothetical protein Cylst_5274 [Cylindrospermum stagnale PCC 7417]|uniref:Uncharacterized protein n=1 Tax=Cylindrospermum stagnale PCC 7417 TaxID=56107 RepID=K9X5F9_9NOST|nr:hypothetical protein Cylst_5274 [Cylindrospermum stagnale PCC 7417]